MRAGPVAVLILFVGLLPATLEAKPLEPAFQPYGEFSGRFEFGVPALGGGSLPPDQEAAYHRAFSFDINDCHRELLFRLDYDPANTTLLGDPAPVALLHRFELVLSHATGEPLPNGTLLWSTPGVRPLSVAEPGTIHGDLFLRQGHDVTYTLAIHGWMDLGAECTWQGLLFISELESNPPGTDAGNEWIEVLNAGLNEADLSGWRVVTHHGRTESHEFPAGTLLTPGERLLVVFGAQFLDNEDEEVSLMGSRGWEVDRTPVLSDEANDDRSWQRSPDATESWSFATGTPAAPNA